MPRRNNTETHEIVQKLIGANVAIMSGFHSPVEQGLLDMLLRRKHPVIICPARSVENMRIPAAWKKGIDEDWIAIVSPFEKKYRRMTAELAEKRNRFIAEQADDILIAHAEEGGRLEKLALELIDSGKRVWTFESEWNERLIKRGAKNVKSFFYYEIQ